MSTAREGTMKEGSSHSLAFRVMRLCRPALQVDLPLRFDAHDLRFGEDDPGVPAPSLSGADNAFASRSELHSPLDACGLSGMMVLPQTFGQIFLGETFCSYISVGNHSDHDVRDVVIKAELQTERQRITLSDNKTEFLRAGGRYDFIIDHDIKELGPHTLVCSAVYVDTDGERKYLPQYFKFQASNPLSVRTKVRTVKENTFLEACIENSTKAPLFLEQVRFDPAPAFTVTPLEPDDRPSSSSSVSTEDGPLSSHLRKINLVKASGGTRHYLYHLRKVGPGADMPSSASTAGGGVPSPPKEGGNTLGKLEIMWRTTLGELGRLQTQQILGNPASRKEVELRLVEPPKNVLLEQPFLMRCRLVNTVEHAMGPLRVAFAAEDPNAPPRSIAVSGPSGMTVPEMLPHSHHDFEVCLVALAPGVQRISGLGVTSLKDGKPFDALPPVDVFVGVGKGE